MWGEGGGECIGHRCVRASGWYQSRSRPEAFCQYWAWPLTQGQLFYNHPTLQLQILVQMKLQLQISTNFLPKGVYPFAFCIYKYQLPQIPNTLLEFILCNFNESAETEIC